jgi:hypothetical protein
MVSEAECNYWKREAQRLREAIADALADLHPGHAPYSLLADALKLAFDEEQG